MIDFNKLKKLPTRYDANKKFVKRFKIYYYFSAKYKEDETHEYYLFDSEFSFEKNFQLMQDKFKFIEGYWSLYTDDKKYPISIPINKNIQTEMFV